MEEDLLNYQIDVFYDAPMGSKGAAISAYAAYTQMGFGKRYLRNAAVLNPVNGSSNVSLNGGGNGIPLYGTGRVIYTQVGYLLPPNFWGEKELYLQAYFQYMNADYDVLSTPMHLFDVGINYFIDSYKSKITLNYQNRPNYQLIDAMVSERKNTFTLQLQIAI